MNDDDPVIEKVTPEAPDRDKVQVPKRVDWAKNIDKILDEMPKKTMTKKMMMIKMTQMSMMML